jgi:hypothetical protein
MTEWDHGHEAADRDPGAQPDPASAAAPDAPLAEPADLDDPYGSPAESGPAPDHAEPPAAEPAGLPAEDPADRPAWDAERSGSGSADWEAPDHSFHDAFGTAEPDPGDGTDPAGWSAGAGSDPFPPTLDLDVRPADGGPWVDPALLGGARHWTADAVEPVAPTDPPAALLPDLAAADGDPDAGWDTLRDSDDPAVRALTRHWNP